VAASNLAESPGAARSARKAPAQVADAEQDGAVSGG
jgi:hypothetical protein